MRVIELPVTEYQPHHCLPYTTTRTWVELNQQEHEQLVESVISLENRFQQVEHKINHTIQRLTQRLVANRRFSVLNYLWCSDAAYRRKWQAKLRSEFATTAEFIDHVRSNYSLQPQFTPHYLTKIHYLTLTTSAGVAEELCSVAVTRAEQLVDSVLGNTLS